MPVRWPVSGIVYFDVYCNSQIFIDFKTLTTTKNSSHIENIPSFVNWKVVWKYSCIKRPTQSYPPEVQPLNGRRRSRKVHGFDINDTQARAHYIWGADSTKSCTSNDLNSARIEFLRNPASPEIFISLKTLGLKVGRLYYVSRSELIYRNGSFTFALGPLCKNHTFNKRQSFPLLRMYSNCFTVSGCSTILLSLRFFDLRFFNQLFSSYIFRKNGF